MVQHLSTRWVYQRAMSYVIEPVCVHYQRSGDVLYDGDVVFCTGTDTGQPAVRLICHRCLERGGSVPESVAASGASRRAPNTVPSTAVMW